MKYIKRIKVPLLAALYILSILVFCFLYFITYRTDSREYWYREMHNQSENFIQELKEATGL